MKIHVAKTAEELGAQAAHTIAEKLCEAIAESGEARLVLSTGGSQFETLKALLQEDVPWEKVTAFHLDEYIDLPITHAASFRKYLKDRFIDHVHLKEFVFVETEGDVDDNIRMLTRRLREKTIDVGVIGIGENAHIAFNDPPADFDTKTGVYHCKSGFPLQKTAGGRGLVQRRGRGAPSGGIYDAVSNHAVCAHYFASAAQGESRRGEKGAFR